MVQESKRLEFIVCKKGNSPTVCPITSLGQNNTYIFFSSHCLSGIKLAIRKKCLNTQ